MQTAVIVKYDNPPKPGKKMAHIKDPGGVLYWYYPDKMGFQVGETVTIDYDVQDWSGKPANVIKQIVPNGYQPAQRQAASAAPSPAPVGHNGNGHASDKDRLIFVTGVVGRALGSGQFGATDIGMLTKAAAVAFAETFGDAS